MRTMLRFKMKAGCSMAVLVCALAPAFGQAVKDLPQPTGYVSDFAHVMSDSTKAQIDRLCSRTTPKIAAAK